jgi:hypothetical protein
MSATETLITAGAGVVVGLVPFGYTVRKDRRERQERAKAEAAREQEEQQRELERAKADAAREQKEQQRELERRRERLKAVATRYLDLLGKAMALLEAVLVDADNADELLQSADEAHSDLQGHAQSKLFMDFHESPPVIWSDRVCRTVLRKGLEMSRAARSQRQTGDAARETQRAIRELTMTGIDTDGPRDLFRWASEEATERWPKPLTTFDEEPWAADTARTVANDLGIDPPP